MRSYISPWRTCETVIGTRSALAAGVLALESSIVSRPCETVIETRLALASGGVGE